MYSARMCLYGIKWRSKSTSHIEAPKTNYWHEYTAKCGVVRNFDQYKVETMVGQHVRLTQYLYGDPVFEFDTAAGIPSSLQSSYDSSADMLTIKFDVNKLPIQALKAELRRMHSHLHHGRSPKNMTLIFNFEDINSENARMMAQNLNQDDMFALLDFWCTLPSKPKKVHVILPDEAASAVLKPFMDLVKTTLSIKLNDRTIIHTKSPQRIKF